MFGISFEHILIVGVVLLLFGPRRLPELGHTMGKAIKNFKDSISGIEEANFKRVDEKAPAAEKTTSAPTSAQNNAPQNNAPQNNAPQNENTPTA